MTDLPWTGDEAFRRELATLSKTRLRLQVSAGALVAIVSASYVLDGMLSGTMESHGLSLFGLTFGLCVAAHYSMMLFAKRAMQP